MMKRIKARVAGQFLVGDKVMLDASKIIDKDAYNRLFYPEDGTIGTVAGIISGAPNVQWPKGSTSLNDRWLCPSHWLKRVKP